MGNFPYGAPHLLDSVYSVIHHTTFHPHQYIIELAILAPLIKVEWKSVYIRRGDSISEPEAGRDRLRFGELISNRSPISLLVIAKYHLFNPRSMRIPIQISSVPSGEGKARLVCFIRCFRFTHSCSPL